MSFSWENAVGRQKTGRRNSLDARLGSKNGSDIFHKTGSKMVIFCLRKPILVLKEAKCFVDFKYVKIVGTYYWIFWVNAAGRRKTGRRSSPDSLVGSKTGLTSFTKLAIKWSFFCLRKPILVLKEAECFVDFKYVKTFGPFYWIFWVNPAGRRKTGQRSCLDSPLGSKNGSDIFHKNGSKMVIFGSESPSWS